MGVHMAPRSQYKHIVFPRLRLGAVVFPKVSSCGLCARLSGELWRGWRHCACWMKKLATCAFCGTETSPFLQLPSHIPPTTTTTFLPLKRITGRNWRLDLSLVCATAISIWQGSLCAVPFSIWRLTLKRELSPYSYLLFDVSDLAVAYLREGQATCAAPFRVITDDGEKARQVWVIYEDFFGCFRKAPVKWTIHWQKDVSAKSAPFPSLHSIHKSSERCTSPFRASPTSALYSSLYYSSD